jgi:Domain of unknown function (DUF4380)
MGRARVARGCGREPTAMPWMARWLTLAALALFARPGSGQDVAKVAISHEPFLGWQDAYRVTNGHVTVSVVPGAGGRVLEFSLDGQNALWMNPGLAGKLYPVPKRPATWSNWRNYGGYKLWPAPQARWPQNGAAAPDPFLDGGAVSVEVIAGSGLRLTGAPSLDMGLVFVRELQLDAATGVLTVQQRMHNIGNKPVDWSIWDVTQIPAPAWVVLPANPASPNQNGILPLGGGQNQWTNENGLIITEYRGVSGKIGADSPGGWVVGVVGDLAYVKRFPPRREDATYPDKGSTVEVYTNDKSLPYIEMEVLGPIVHLEPGEETAYPETWALAKLSQPIRQRADVAAALAELRGRGLLP